MPDPRVAGDGDLVGVGADLQPSTVLAAYRHGMFPMPVEGRLAWWSPARRAVIPVDGLRITRSLRRSCARYELRLDTAFEAVINACATSRRRGDWIDADIHVAYTRLHELGWAHSVEAWTPGPDRQLAGGLYGVAIGGLFAGESMFHHHRDASKVALVGLVELLADSEAGTRALLDVQWQTPHLETLGAVEVSRDEYLTMLGEAVAQPLPAPFR